MPPVFAHGRLRLYLLKLLDESPRHGYEVIRLLEERFQGLYAPSAGTVYPRLAKLSDEGLVTHTTQGGRKVYSITERGRAELADRKGELAELELEIHESLSSLAADIREDVSGSAEDLRERMREEALAAQSRGDSGTGNDRRGRSGRGPAAPPWEDREAWRQVKEDLKRAKSEWREQTRKAREQTLRAQREARRARERAARDAQAEAAEEIQRIARRVQEQVHSHVQQGDWQSAVRDGMAELAREMGGLGRFTGQGGSWPPFGASRPPHERPREEGPEGDGAEDRHRPEWADEEPGDDPARDLERLLDRFRDEVRDAARDEGVTGEQFREARRQLADAAAHIGAVLRPARED
ncbi:PadR family transcriptional regulator [Streptomyces sp. NPDC005438]|uniref:PadR family transcriptional regulator n=1 Tax=Streptomyces sp. NPDC005438 TaxID=3156880 RepID=UPI0033BE3654